MGVGILVLALKLGAWWMTGSLAVLSDAIESIVNVAAAIVALWAVWLADRPADTEHPYGHHKAELLSAVFEGVLILLAALFILHAVWVTEPQRLLPQIAWPGLLLMGLATLLNVAWARYLILRGRVLRAPALVADGQHLWVDVITTVGVVLGILLAVFTGHWWLDPLLAAIVALHVLWSGGRLLCGSLSSLLDAALPPEALERVQAAISEEAGGALEAHDLRSRVSGRVTFIEFHLIVPGDMLVREAHMICDRLEEAILKVQPGSQTVIHLEPEDQAERGDNVIVPKGLNAGEGSLKLGQTGGPRLGDCV